MSQSLTSALIVFLFCTTNAFSISPEEHGDSANTAPQKFLRIYTTTRLTTDRPTIDGKLDDLCWTTGESTSSGRRKRPTTECRGAVPSPMLWATCRISIQETSSL
jgi:hypothetical protein